IEQTLAMMAGMRDEARVVNEAIEEFTAARKIAEGGISSVAQLDRIIQALKALERKLPDARRRVRTDNGRTVIGQLAEAVQRDLGQLATIRDQIGEDAEVGPLVQKFNTMMEGLTKGGGITSREMLVTVQKFFQQLKREAEAARGRVRGAQARQTLDQLLDAINTILRQLSGN